MTRAFMLLCACMLAPGAAQAAVDYGYGPQPPQGPLLDLRPYLGAETEPGFEPAPRLPAPREPLAQQAAAAPRFALQVGAFSDREAAASLRARLERLGRTWLESVEVGGRRLHRVRFGGFHSREAAQVQAAALLGRRLVEAAVVVPLQ